MFRAAVLTTAKRWKQLKCPPTNEKVSKMRDLLYDGIAVKRKQPMTYTTRRLNPKDIVLNAMSATKIPIRLRLNEIL